MSSLTMSRGALIVIEGIDRSGKSTQAARLVESLVSRGRRAVLYRFPDRTTPIGRQIDAYLKGEEEYDDRVIHLLFSANRWELRRRMLAETRQGRTIVCDRYAYSGMAYSMAKGLDAGWCKASDCSLPRPDLIVYLDTDADTAAGRASFGHERFEQNEFQQLVAARFQEIREDDWLVLDARKSIPSVADDLLTAAETCLSKVRTLGHVIDEIKM